MSGTSPRSSPLLASVIVLAAAAVTGSAAGVRWSVPARWTVLPQRAMRVATYAIPGPKGAEAGECGVFHFGEGRGGGVEENTARWSSQFEGEPAPKKGERTINGIRVHLVEISGTYLAPGGPMMQSQGRKPGYRLLGAIAKAPEGLVFFKCTGPGATMGAARGDFDRMVSSLARTGTAVAVHPPRETR
jgi:hypothetical protein